MTAPKPCHRLQSLSVIGGFLDGMTIEFADGLNCLIGHRGTGKTTVLEFIRYALDEFPRDDTGQARKRVETLVRKNLGDGRIRLKLQTKDGLEYIVDRTAIGDPLVLTADEQPTNVRINSAGLFSADIFSQNEVENIADSPQSQLELIDRFAAAELDEIQTQIDASLVKLDANATSILTARRQLESLVDEVGTLAVIQAKIKSLAETQGDPQTNAVNVAHRYRAMRGQEQQALKESQDLISKYRQWLGDAAGQFQQSVDAAFDASILGGPNGSLLRQMHQRLNAVGADLDRLFEQGVAALDAGGETMTEQAEELQRAHQQQELAFRDLIAKHKQAQGVATERAGLEKRRTELLTKERRKRDLQKQIDQMEADRSALAGDLQGLWGRRFAVRRRVADWINQGATSPIRVRIDQCGDRSDYQTTLAGWLKGAVTQYNPPAAKIAELVPPSVLKRLLIEDSADDLQSQADLGDSQMPKIMDALRRTEVLLKLDVMELADEPKIELLDGEAWKNSLQLSTGQKCTTILPILLLESDNPLLVDQPEDNLDNRYIYDTVVNAINRVKEHRQIILITHNPNIPVLGEAAAVFVLNSDGERSELANEGTVDQCKGDIINLLEGGEEAFVRRKERYAY